MLMNCKDATRAISDGLDRHLSTSDRVKLRVHLFICHYCRNFVRQTRFLRRAASLHADKHDHRH